MYFGTVIPAAARIVNADDDVWIGVYGKYVQNIIVLILAWRAFWEECVFVLECDNSNRKLEQRIFVFSHVFIKVNYGWINRFSVYVS